MKQPKPYLSHAPWKGFSRHDWRRGKPLPKCPSPRCRRAKACHDAHEGLYCQRTHISPALIEAILSHDPIEQEIAALPVVSDPMDIKGLIKRQLDIRIIGYDRHQRMTELWKAGAFDDLYGPYTSKGVLMKPPPKIYTDSSFRRTPESRRRQGDSGVRRNDVP